MKTPKGPTSPRVREWCETATQQQEALAACLDWLRGPEVEARATFPTLDAQDLVELSFDDSLVVGLLQQRGDQFLTDMKAIRMATRDTLTLRPRGDVVQATYIVTDAWRDTRLAARWLLRSHGTPEQQARMAAARARHPGHEARRPLEKEPSHAASVLGRIAGLIRSPATKPGVLIVDDDADSREAFELFVTARFPYLRVLTARSGADALNALLDPGLVLVISDLNMPDQDGIEFLQEAGERHPEVQRYLMTGYSGPAIEKRAKEAGLDGVLHKPLQLAQLSEMLRSAERGEAIQVRSSTRNAR